MGLIPVYQDYLEGYIHGGLVNAEGQPVQGVTVFVSDSAGKELDQFSPGVTDLYGIFRVRFSLPIHWHKVDVTAQFYPESWNVIEPYPKFRFYFDRQTGVLSYAPIEQWYAVRQGESMVKIEKKNPKKFSTYDLLQKKKEDDPFSPIEDRAKFKPKTESKEDKNPNSTNAEGAAGEEGSENSFSFGP